MAIGIRNFFRLAADQVITSNAVLANLTGFVIPVAVGQIVSGRVRGVFDVGATGGVQMQLVRPGAGDVNVNLILANTVTPATIFGVNLTGALFTNALAVAGTHFFDLEFSAVIATAGNLSFQMAQATSDVLSLTVQQGTFMDVVIL